MKNELILLSMYTKDSEEKIIEEIDKIRSMITDGNNNNLKKRG